MVDNDGELRVRRFSAGIFSVLYLTQLFHASQFRIQHRHACMPKLEVKEIPILSRRGPAFNVFGRDALRFRMSFATAARFASAEESFLQHNAQVIRASGLLAGSALAEV